MSKLGKEAVKSWSSTLRLPKSTFPARTSTGDLSTYLKRCADDLYKWQTTAPPSTKLFTLHDGPPYANGDLHVGHALNKILKDIICRTKLIQGYRIDFTPGWDCHGLPIELKALEKLGWKASQERDAVAVRQAARAFAQAAVHKQMEGFKSWGVMGPWAKHWKTMDTTFELRQLSVFREMARKGLIYRKHKPVYWSPSSRTALAEAELEYNDHHISTAALVKFVLRGSLADSFAEPLYAAIWTTTPWTLPANQAIAVNKHLTYSIVHSQSTGLLVVAKARVPYLESLTEQHLRILDANLSLSQLLSSTYEGPTMFRSSSTNRPIIHADFVTEDSGTGLVHCAPAHGMEDYEALQPLVQCGRIAVDAPVDEHGNFTSLASSDDPSYLQGINVFGEGNERVIQAMNREGLFLAQHRYKHKYPYDWRTKKPIIIRATAQWFADVSNVKESAQRALDSVQFQPISGEPRLRSFIANRNEWCISRQRAWGVPIPALYHKVTGEAVLTDASVGHIMKVIEERGIDAWWSDAPDEPAWVVNGLVPSEHLRGTDTMDVWFDSGTSWTQMTNPESSDDASADVYVEGTDQHRGWFQSSLLTHVAFQDSLGLEGPPKSPFRRLLTHGFTLDAEGKKMSKSIGNVVSPDAIISGQLDTSGADATPVPKKGRKQQGSLGPDALRLWVASSDWTRDVVIGDTIIKTVHAALHKYRVTFKLLLGALQDYDASQSIALDTLPLADRIAMFQLQQVSRLVRGAYESLEFYKAVTAINRWVNAEFSGFYMESVKDTLYCDSRDTIRRRGAQTVLYHVLYHLQIMLGPITPVLVEETWAHTADEIKMDLEHPLRRLWQPLVLPENITKAGELQLPAVLAINTAVKVAQERARSLKKIGSSLETKVVLHLKQTFKDIFTDLEATELQDILVVSQLQIMTLGDGHLPLEILSGSTWACYEHVNVPGSGNIGFAEVVAADRSKCSRCWRFNVDKEKSNTDESDDISRDICQRCHKVVSGIVAGGGP